MVLVTGDGAFGLSAMEMDTAARHHLPVIVVVANNCGWGDVRHHQREMYHREVASALADTRYDQLAEALGCHGERVEQLSDLRPALERAASAGGPALIDVRTDPDVGGSAESLLQGGAVGDEPVPRRTVRTEPQQLLRCQHLVQRPERRQEAVPEPEPARRQARRPD